MRVRVLLLAGVLWCAATPAHADLIDLGDGLIYDTVQDLTWMQDVMYTRTAGLDADGLFTRLFGDEAVIEFVNSISYAGSDDWRLPTFHGTGIFWNSDSEVSTLMRGLGWFWETDPGDPLYHHYQGGGTGPFVNFTYPIFLQPDSGASYLQWWSPFYDVDYAEDSFSAVWLVHDGKLDPGYSAGVPEPSTTLLVGIGLASFGLRKLRGRRRRA